MKIITTKMFSCAYNMLFILISFSSVKIVVGVASSLQMFVDELPQMQKLNAYNGVRGSPTPGSLTIGMFEAKWKFHRDLPVTTVFAYGTSQVAASVPGPTIEALQGTPVSITWQNHLPQSHILSWDPTIPTATPKYGGVPTVAHLHGGVHEPQSDGSALAWFTNNFRETGPSWSKQTYAYPNVQNSGNLWYHDHALGLTRENLLAGLIGNYVIRNLALDDTLDLPSGPEFDRHLMIFDRSFNRDGSIYMNATGINPTIHPQWQPEYFGDTIIVNGKAWPYLRVKRRKYRFRIVNAANARYFGLSLSNGLPFVHVASDSSYLNKPITTQNFLLAPSESADVVVDFSKSTTSSVVLKNDAPYPYPIGTPVDTLNGNVVNFIIEPITTVPDTSSIPTNIAKYPSAVANGASKTRYITFYEYSSAAGTPTHLYINGKRFEDPVTETPKSGTTEVWEVINLTGDNHPLHIHLATFQAIMIQEIVDVVGFKACMTTLNDAVACNITGHVAAGKLITVPDYQKTWKNVIQIVPGYKTTVVVKFYLVDTGAQYPFDATAEPGYVYHCHILDHEDNAMIRPLKFV